MRAEAGQYAGELFRCGISGMLAPGPVGGAAPTNRMGTMSYFVTGATGFVGRYLVDNLLKRDGTVYVLVRKDSQKKFDALAKREGWDPKRVVAVTGDMTLPKCG